MKTLKTVVFIFFFLLLISSQTTLYAQSWKELDSLGIKLYYAGKFEESLAMFEKSKNQAEKEFGKDHENYANTIANLAVIYTYIGNYEKAEPLHLESLQMLEKSLGKKHDDYLLSLKNLAGLYQLQGNYTKAEIPFKELIEICKEMKCKNYGLFLSDLALLYYYQGKYRQAEILLKEAIPNIEKVMGKEAKELFYTNAINSLGLLYSEQGFYSKAEPLFVEAREICGRAVGKDHPNYASYLSNLAEVYNKQNLYSKAEQLYIESIQITEKKLGKEHHNYAISLNNLAETYLKQNLYAKAELLFIETLQIREKITGKENLDYAAILSNLGNLYEKQGLHAKAEKLLLESLRLTEKIVGKNHKDYAECLNDLGQIYGKQAMYYKAEPMYLESLAITEELLGKKHSNYASFASNLADMYIKQKSYFKAEPMYLASIQAKLSELQTNYANLSENEKKQYFEANQIFFDSFYSFTTEILQKEPSYPSLPSLLQTALNLQLQTKGLLLSETSKMKNRILASGDTSLMLKFESWQAVKNSISKAYNMPIADREKKGIDIGKLENEANEIERGLSARSEDFKEAFSPPTYTYQDIQKKLGEGEVAIEMIRTEYKNQETDKADTAYLALIVTAKDIKPVFLKNGKGMEGSLFGSYRRNISLNREDKESYGAFWAEIAKGLTATSPLPPSKGENARVAISPPSEGAGGRRIYFSPDGIYHSINLNTLMNPETGKYLLDEFDIRIVTNLKEISEEKKPSTAKTASLFGRPAYSMSKQDYEKSVTGLRGGGSEQSNNVLATQKSWKDLAYTEVEIKNIGKLLKKKKWKIDAALGQQAVEERVKKVKNPAILHLATHGYFTPNDSKSTTNNMLSSGIVLAGVNTADKGENSDDGILTALEATNMDLDQTDLVVLSACETGLGEVSIGEGIYGLQRGFKVAGAKTIMMSLWSVDDAKTQELMNIFYKNWLGGSSKREAFKQAQLLMKTKYKNPAFWGGFVMIGE